MTFIHSFEQKLTDSKICFKPLEIQDWPVIQFFRSQPHVMQWWGDPGDAKQIQAYIQKKIETEYLHPYLARIGNQNIGYIQMYEASKVGNGWWMHEDENTLGIDQYLGGEQFLGQGLGQRMITEFLIQLFEQFGERRVVLDPSPDNERAIRCYKRLGFIEEGLIETPDGAALLMSSNTALYAG